jgi:hypothetical protein
MARKTTEQREKGNSADAWSWCILGVFSMDRLESDSGLNEKLPKSQSHYIPGPGVTVLWSQGSNLPVRQEYSENSPSFISFPWFCDLRLLRWANLSLDFHLGRWNLALDNGIRLSNPRCELEIADN